MLTVNQVSLMGFVGKDPEVKSFGESNMQVCTFGIATTESYKDKKGEWQNKTTWHDIKCWRKCAEEAGRRIRKGDCVSVYGKLEKESWEKDGVRQYRTYVVCDRFNVSIPEEKQPDEQDSCF